MTQTLTNRMTTNPNQVFVACNSLQPREEMLEGKQMAETHGGTAIPWGPIVYGVLIAIDILYDMPEEETDEVTSCSCSCQCGGN